MYKSKRLKILAVMFLAGIIVLVLLGYIYIFFSKVISIPNVGLELMALRSRAHALLTEPDRWPGFARILMNFCFAV